MKWYSLTWFCTLDKTAGEVYTDIFFIFFSVYGVHVYLCVCVQTWVLNCHSTCDKIRQQLWASVFLVHFLEGKASCGLPLRTLSGWSQEFPGIL